MQKTKLVTLLKTFSKQEMKDFEKFISSPYFSPGRNLKPLFNVLKKYYPGFDSPNFTGENLYRKVFYNKKFEKKKSLHVLQVMFSDLMILAEKFIVYQDFEKSEEGIASRYAQLGMRLIRDKFLIKEAMDIAVKNKSRLDKLGSEEIFYFNRIINNEVIVVGNYYNQEFIERSNNIKFQMLYHIQLLFDDLLIQLNQISAATNKANAQLKGLKTIKSLINNFDPVIFDNEYEDDNIGTKNIVLMNYFLCKVRVNPEDDNIFRSSLNTYYKNFENFNRTNKVKYFIRLHSICSVKAREIDFYTYGAHANKLSSFVFTKGLYRYNDNDYLHQTNYIAYFLFKAYFLNANELKKYIDKAIDDVKPEHKELCKNYSYVYLYLKSKEFENGLKVLSKINVADINLKSTIYKLKAVLLFELGYYDEVLSGLDTYEHFLRNNKSVSDNNKQEGLAFISLLKCFIKINLNPGIKYSIEKELLANKNSPLGFWIREKLEKLNV